MTFNTSKIPNNFASTMTAVNGFKIHALESENKGLAQPMVMIHGAWASRRYLVPAAILLAKSMPVFVPEMPGHGSSSKPKHALTVQQQAEVICAWIQEKGLKNVSIFGNSYGCQVAAQLVVDHPELVSNLILTDSTVDPKAHTMVQTAYRLYLDGFFEPKASKKQLIADLLDMGPLLAFETVQRMLDDDIRINLAKIKCRTLIVRGENDPIAPQKWSEEMARRIPNSQLCVIPNAPHCVNYATPTQLTRIILDFLNESRTTKIA